jgi:hypothetical protein
MTERGPAGLETFENLRVWQKAHALVLGPGTVPERGLSRAGRGSGTVNAVTAPRPAARRGQPGGICMSELGSSRLLPVSCLLSSVFCLLPQCPGVYFVRSEPSAVSREPSAVRKVVITR